MALVRGHGGCLAVSSDRWPFKYRCATCGRGMETIAASIVTCRHAGTAKAKEKAAVMVAVETGKEKE